MKKRCKYCNGIVKINEEEIKNIEGNGRGVLCDLCGGFISIPKKIDGNIRLSSGYIGRGYRRRSSYKKSRIRKQKIACVIAIILLIPITYFIIVLYNPFLGLQFVNDEKPYSEFQLICNETRYDMSTDIKISIWEPKVGIEFDDENDIRNLSNYQLLIDSEFPVDIIIDLRSFEDCLLTEINTNNYPNYTHYYAIINGGINLNYVFWAKYIGD